MPVSADKVLDDLRTQFPHIQGKAVLSPEDLVPIINKSVNHQNKLRNEGRFYIPTLDKNRKKGEAVEISVYELAEYLANPEAYKAKSESTEAISKVGRPAGTTKKVLAARAAERSKRIGFWVEVDRLVAESELSVLSKGQNPFKYANI